MATPKCTRFRPTLPLSANEMRRVPIGGAGNLWEAYELKQKEYTYQQIADEFSARPNGACTKQAVAQAFKRYKVPAPRVTQHKRQPKKLTEERVESIFAELMSHGSLQKAAADFSVSVSAIRERLIKAGQELAKRIDNSYLESLQNGELPEDIAKKLGIPVQVVLYCAVERGLDISCRFYRAAHMEMHMRMREALALRADKVALKTVAQQLGLHLDTLAKWQRNAHKLLSPRQRESLLVALRQPHSADDERSLAQEYGLPFPAVRALAKQHKIHPMTTIRSQLKCGSVG